eukprot:20991-Heterococcus_DN1.PRE.2
MHSAGSAGDKSKRVRIPSAKARSESAAAGKHAAAASEDVKAIKEAESPAPVKQPSAEKPSHGEETEGTGAAESSPRSPVTLELKQHTCMVGTPVFALAAGFVRTFSLGPPEPF